MKRAWGATRQGWLAAACGVLFGALALVTQLHPKTSTHLAAAAVVLVCACMVTGNPERFLLAALVLDIPLEWGKNFFYDAATATKYGALGGLSLTGTTLALAGLYAIWAFGGPARSGRAPRMRWRSAAPLVLYVGVNALSLIVARNRVLGAYELVMLLQLLLVFVYVANHVRTRDDVRFVFTMLMVGVVLEALIIIGIYVTGHNFRVLGIGDRVDPGSYDGRVGGTVGSPNGAAAYLGLLLPVALAGLTAPLGRRVARLTVAAVIFGAVALLVTGSRGGWISCVLSTVILIVWALRRGLIAPRALVVPILASVAVITPFWGEITHRVTGNDNGSAQSRFAMDKLAEEMISAHPLLGLGVNNVGINIPNYAGPEFDGQWIYTIHNKYLLVWAEAGIGALLTFLWFLGATLRRGVRCARSRDPVLGPIAAGLTAGAAGQLVHMAVDIFQSKPQMEGLWLTAALLVAIEAIARRTPAPIPNPPDAATARRVPAWVIGERPTADRIAG